MCLIVVSPKEHPAVTRLEFEDAWHAHSDGGGLMFADRGEVRLWKPYWNGNKFYRAYLRARKQTDNAVILHFRQATHGKKNAVNTHPHPIHKGSIALVHNGILALTDDSQKLDVSDTVIWARYVFNDMKPEDIFKLDFGEWQPGMVGSKLVFLRGDGDMAIFGESAGSWVDGRWYSNRWHIFRRSSIVSLNSYRKDEPTRIYGYSMYRETYNPVTRKWEKWHR